MELAQALEEGKVSGLLLPDRTIVTHLSKLFICGERVFKAYKNEEYFFGDLRLAEVRRDFITEDFFWNNAAAPEIYRHLWGVKKTEAGFELVPHTLGDDFLIEMSAIDDSKTLTKLLTQGELQEEHVVLFVDTLVDTLATLTNERRDKLSALYKKSLAQIMKEDIETLYVWMRDTAPHIPREDTERIKQTLMQAIDTEPYFMDAKSESYTAAIDANSDNLLLLEGKPSMIDIMPPRFIWRLVDEYATVSRLIVDIEVLGTEKLTSLARESYTSYGRALPKRAALVQELRAASIQWAYRYMLKQPELAQKFAVYALKKREELEALL